MGKMPFVSLYMSRSNPHLYLVAFTVRLPVFFPRGRWNRAVPRPVSSFFGVRDDSQIAPLLPEFASVVNHEPCLSFMNLFHSSLPFSQRLFQPPLVQGSRS